MSYAGCRTDDECCYQDDSGAEELRYICVGLAIALVVAVMVLFWVVIAWQCFSDVKRSKDTAHGAAPPLTRSTISPAGDEPETKNMRSEVIAEAPRCQPPQPLTLASLRSFRSMESMDKPPIRAGAIPPSPASTAALEEDVRRLRILLDTERSRRMAVESGFTRRTSTPSSLGTSASRASLRKFPSARAIEGHAVEATENAARWVQSATRRTAETDPQLTSLVNRVLVQLFATCEREVRRRLEKRVEGLRTFLGRAESVQLGGPAGTWGGNMPSDTKELMYDELRKRYRTIAAVGRQELVSLSARVLAGALESEEQRELGRSVVHQTWPSFEPLLRSYLALFVECQLQQPQVEFDGTIGKMEVYDSNRHRELATLVPDEHVKQDANATCSVVFPSIIATQTRFPPSEMARSAVITWNDKYTVLDTR